MGIESRRHAAFKRITGRGVACAALNQSGTMRHHGVAP
jgi:hypothetical protein